MSDSHLEDERLFGDVRRVTETFDPIPDGMIERMVAVTRDVALADPDLELQLMLVVERFAELVGTRGGSRSYTLRFGGEGVDLLVRVGVSEDEGRARLDGWLVPAASAPVQVREVGGAGRTLRRGGRDQRPVRVPRPADRLLPCIASAARRPDVRHARVRDLTRSQSGGPSHGRPPATSRSRRSPACGAALGEGPGRTDPRPQQRTRRAGIPGSADHLRRQPAHRCQGRAPPAPGRPPQGGREVAGLGGPGGPREGQDQGAEGRGCHGLDQRRQGLDRPGAGRVVPPAEGAAAPEEEGPGRAAGVGLDHVVDTRPMLPNPFDMPHTPDPNAWLEPYPFDMPHPFDIPHPFDMPHPMAEAACPGLVSYGAPGSGGRTADRLRRPEAGPDSRQGRRRTATGGRDPRHRVLPALLVRRWVVNTKVDAGRHPIGLTRSRTRPRAPRRPDRSLRRLHRPDRRTRHLHRRARAPGLPGRRDPVLAGHPRHRAAGRVRVARPRSPRSPSWSAGTATARRAATRSTC